VKPPPSPSPNPQQGHDGPTLALQTGGKYKALNGSVLTYNGTVDTWISTQDVADYNNFQVRVRFAQVCCSGCVHAYAHEWMS
jgi:hypothetical protein